MPRKKPPNRSKTPESPFKEAHSGHSVHSSISNDSAKRDSVPQHKKVTSYVSPRGQEDKKFK